VFRVVDHPSSLSTLGLAAAGRLCLHSGHLQTFYYATLFLGAYVLVCCVSWLREGKARRARQVLRSCALASLLAAASAAYLLLPLAAETSLTSRTTTDYSFFLSRGPFPLTGLTTFLHPEAQGTPIDGSYERIELWEDVAYFGAVAQALALLGIFLGWRQPRTRFLAISFALATLLIFDTPLLRLLYEVVPGFSLFRIPERFLFLTSLFGILLAGVGAQELWRWMQRYGDDPRIAVRLSPHALMAALLLAVFAEGFYYAKRYVNVARRNRSFRHPTTWRYSLPMTASTGSLLWAVPRSTTGGRLPSIYSCSLGSTPTTIVTSTICSGRCNSAARRPTRRYGST
jgi:hypothetical protein